MKTAIEKVKEMRNDGWSFEDIRQYAIYLDDFALLNAAIKLGKQHYENTKKQ